MASGICSDSGRDRRRGETSAGCPSRRRWPYGISGLVAASRVLVSVDSGHMRRAAVATAVVCVVRVAVAVVCMAVDVTVLAVVVHQPALDFGGCVRLRLAVAAAAVAMAFGGHVHMWSAVPSVPLLADHLSRGVHRL